MPSDIVTITALSHDGRGIASIDGKKIFIDNALMGETVRFLIKKKHRRYDEGRALEILVTSNDRVTPACPHFEICGGCSLQHLSKEGQLTLKQNALLEQLAHFGQVSPENLLPPLSDRGFGYRRKARLSVKYVHKKEKVLVGFHEKRTHKVADLSHCQILVDRFSQLITPIQQLITTLKGYSTIAQIEIAKGDHDDALVFRHLEPLTSCDLEKLKNFGKQENVRIYLQSGNKASIELAWPEWDNKNEHFLLQYSVSTPSSQPIHFKFHPLDFIQINADMNQKMLDRAIALLDIRKEDRVLDLFCGLGNFTLPFATLAKEVVGVEGSEEMITLAKQNALLNNIDNVEFFAQDLYKMNEESEHWQNQYFDKILIDPPRSGAENLMSILPKLLPKRIVYVSCNPATFARDIGILVKQQYRLESLGIMDMFPQTNHTESIALLVRNK